jgi:hypothetical protein
MTTSKLKAFNGKQFKDVMELMYALRDAGFDHEFDNGLVMRALWDALDRLWKQAKTRGFHIQTWESREHTSVPVLRIALCSNETVSQVVNVLVAERGESLAVYTDVVREPVVPRKHDLSLLGKSVEWAKAHEVLMANPRFSHYAVEGFKAMRTSVKPKDATTPHHVRFTPTQTGMHVAFMVAGKSVLSLTLDYSYEAMAA